MRVFSTFCLLATLHVSSGCSRNDHEVVSVVREFLKYIENADYDHAIDLGTPGEFTRDGLAREFGDFELSQARVIEAYVGKKHAGVLTHLPVQMGFSLIKNGDGWLIRDTDRLPDDQWVQKWLAGFRRVEPDAEVLLIPR